MFYFRNISKSVSLFCTSTLYLNKYTTNILKHRSFENKLKLLKKHFYKKALEFVEAGDNSELKSTEELESTEEKEDTNTNVSDIQSSEHETVDVDSDETISEDEDIDNDDEEE